MHVKDVLDNLDLRLELPQHWFSTDVSNEFEDAQLIQNDGIVKIRTDEKKHFIRIRRTAGSPLRLMAGAGRDRMPLKAPPRPGGMAGPRRRGPDGAPRSQR